MTKSATTTAPSRNGKASPRVIDVDAARAARLEKLGPPPVVRIGGRDFELPPELPADAIYNFGEVQAGNIAALRPALEALFGPEADVILSLAPSWADQEYLIGAAMESYGLTFPES